jgi:transketolase
VTLDQSDIFRGGSATASRQPPGTVVGTPTQSIPAFVVGEELADIADTDDRIVVLAADLASANRTVDFQRRHPDRFVNVGIAEKNMVTVAAGMAACGLIPYAATFASFAALLCCEQIRTDCAYPGLPVRVIGHHSGMSMGFYGTSHHALEDLGMMRTIADLTVVCATDANQLRALLQASVNHPGAMYLRLGRGRDPMVYPEPPVVTIGRAIRLRNGEDLTLIATGSEVRPALDAAELLAADGISTRVLDMHTIKPLDHRAVIAAAHDTGGILTVEEHNITGGMGSAVAEVLSEAGIAVPFRRHGIADLHVEIGPPKALYSHYLLDAAGIAETARAFLAKKAGANP